VVIRDVGYQPWQHKHHEARRFVTVMSYYLSFLPLLR
jgi:hypothetical protein